VIIDGCGMNCAKKIVQQVGAPVHQHLVVTDMGVEKKSGDRLFTPEQVEAIASAAWKGEGKSQESGAEGKKPSDNSGGCDCVGKCS
jgi:uncharacterized metal-binding protein